MIYICSRVICVGIVFVLISYHAVEDCKGIEKMQVFTTDIHH